MSRRSGRSRPLPLDENGSKASDDQSSEIDDAEEVTRCICGNDELTTIDAGMSTLLQQEYHIKIDTGLFIQCEKCLVWQHGYCVGLFINEDVPDKYWCEECKPDLHRFVYGEDGHLTHTLYRSVNDDRQKLVASVTAGASDGEQSEKSEAKTEKSTRLRSRRSPKDTPEANGLDSGSSGPYNRQERKDRRHGDDSYDAQLQRAMRESARASSAGASDRKRAGEPTPGSVEKKTHSEELEHDVEESNVDEESEATVAKRELRARPKPRAKPKPRAPAAKGRASTPKNDNSAALSKDELLSQLSRPRFVNDKSSIYELRKRTGAILEWLGRTQMELEEERDAKTSQFSDVNTSSAGPVTLFDENLKLMENLTEKILSWEQKFGKYAP
ncbi:CIC11C00000000330 [Sungouiella intermedia]|uniref:CIC11C00000000330 n=1 Tax=Sungouiella intermedia TaxID=45354 RepID=A0A1L0BSN1_9ASCO|nr:CIC11C00000000330 [[Candida] intermedia]